VNLFALPSEPLDEELFERIAGDEEILVERIVSSGQSTAVGEWLEQDRDEWVALLQGEAELTFADGRGMVLRPGDHVLVPAGTRDRVERTSFEPMCVWLAVHARGLRAG
jgi:cupin 2 domain-containing protein